jgi:hypothetical protein
MRRGRRKFVSIIEAAKEAILVQDACNLSGVVYAFDAVVDILWTEARRRGKGTDWVNTHAISKLFCDKMADLSGARSFEDFCSAYAECRKLADQQGSTT